MCIEFNKVCDVQTRAFGKKKFRTCYCTSNTILKLIQKMLIRLCADYSHTLTESQLTSRYRYSEGKASALKYLSGNPIM